MNDVLLAGIRSSETEPIHNANQILCADETPLNGIY
jgi:hypothetical protein